MPDFQSESASAIADVIGALMAERDSLAVRVAELETAIHAHRDRWAGQSTETDDALYAVLGAKK